MIDSVIPSGIESQASVSNSVSEDDTPQTFTVEPNRDPLKKQITVVNVDEDK